MLRTLYVVLLRLHPRFFRQQFGDEMLWIFDQTASSRGALLGDAVRSLGTQWMFRTEYAEGAGLAAGPGSDRVPVFYTSGSDIPPPGALLNGLIGSVGVFWLACFALAHSGGHARVFTYYGNDFHAGPPVYGDPSGPAMAGNPARSAGKRQPGVWAKLTSLLHGSPGRPEDATGNQSPSKLASATEGPGRDSMAGSPALVLADQRAAAFYFNSIPILAALDSDHDGELSAEEIAIAPAVLLALDKNHDGKLDAEECGYRPPVTASDKNGDGKIQRNGEMRSRTERPDARHPGVAPEDRVARRARLDFMRLEPVLAAIDADHDGTISMTEIGNAPAALKTLDRNHDGRLTLEEVVRDPAANEAAAIFRLDTDFDGRISRAERMNAFGQHVRLLLDAADLNGNRDGYVSWDELVGEIRRRADLNQDGRVTWDELMQARVSGALNGPPREPKVSRMEGK